MILIDELNRCGSLGTLQGLAGGLQIGTPPIYHFGSPEMQKRVLPEIMTGKKRICLAITEPEAGSDVKNLSCSAKRSADGKHFIVNGTKKVSHFSPLPLNRLLIRSSLVDHERNLLG